MNLIKKLINYWGIYKYYKFFFKYSFTIFTYFFPSFSAPLFFIDFINESLLIYAITIQGILSFFTWYNSYILLNDTLELFEKIENLNNNINNVNKQHNYEIKELLKDKIITKNVK